MAGCMEVDLSEGFEPSKLFAGGLSWKTTSESLQEYFQQYGHVEKCEIMHNLKNLKPRGFGFVTFTSSKVAAEVLACRHVLDDKEIDVKPSTPKPTNRIVRKEQDVINKRKIFIGGIPLNATEKEIFVAFEQQFGKVEEVVIMCQPNANNPNIASSRSRGFGFVTFEEELLAKQAVDQGFILIMDKKVEMKRAEPRNPCDLMEFALDRNALSNNHKETREVMSQHMVPSYSEPTYGGQDFYSHHQIVLQTWQQCTASTDYQALVYTNHNVAGMLPNVVSPTLYYPATHSPVICNGFLPSNYVTDGALLRRASL